VVAVDVDPGALAAVKDNARANGVRIETVERDILPESVQDVDVVLAGDVFYSNAMADRVDAFLRRAMRAGTRVLVGDPNRGYLKSSFLQPLVTYDIPVSIAVEGVSSQRTTVFELGVAAAPRS
jgi:predicted nicotinamide N-methyase